MNIGIFLSVGLVLFVQSCHAMELIERRFEIEQNNAAQLAEQQWLAEQRAEEKQKIQEQENLDKNLRQTVKKPFSAETINYLISQKANVNGSCPLGFTPLMYAAIHNNVQAVELLLNVEAEVGRHDSTGTTAKERAAVQLGTAQKLGDFDTAKKLEKIITLLEGR